MPKLASVQDCTGCTSCMNICPKKVIRMEEVGVLGHLYPMVDHTKCIECGKCVKVCPVINPPSLIKASIAYAGWAKNPLDNKRSSSGGVATILSRKVIEEGGIVYGCASEGLMVHHIRITNIKEVDSLRGSKYVQSSMGTIMSLVKQDLHNGRKVLFIGTPCQCAGLKSYLQKEYENLLLVDLICHGTPSLNLLQNHIKHTIKINQEISNISFRSGSNFELILRNTEGNIVYKGKLWGNRYSDAYYECFVSGYTYRKSCNQCKFASHQRCSDITIGDFWGLGKDELFQPIAPSYGYSVILPNTNAGKTMIDNLADLLYLQERNIIEAISGNPQLRGPKRLSLNAKIFQWFLNRGFSLKTSLYCADWYKIPVYKIINIIRR